MAMSTPEQRNSDDVVEFLIQQHHQVRGLLDEVERATGQDRQRLFDEVRELLARHETAEEMVLRPVTRSLPRGDAVASDRLQEENAAKDQLAHLESLDVGSGEFAEAFGRFKAEVLAHADAEEAEEFPLLRAEAEPDRLAQAKSALQAAEKTAPTHPHPSARSTTANYVAGPFAAMLDRARDLFTRKKAE